VTTWNTGGAELRKQTIERARAAWNTRALSAPVAGEGGEPVADYVLVPRSALLWLNGEGPDDEGNWFGDTIAPTARRYWWRSVFRRLIAAAPSPSREAELERQWQPIETAPSGELLANSTVRTPTYQDGFKAGIEAAAKRMDIQAVHYEKMQNQFPTANESHQRLRTYKQHSTLMAEFIRALAQPEQGEA